MKNLKLKYLFILFPVLLLTACNFGNKPSVQNEASEKVRLIFSVNDLASSRSIELSNDEICEILSFYHFELTAKKTGEENEITLGEWWTYENLVKSSEEIYLPSAGEYTFTLTGDNGSEFFYETNVTKEILAGQTNILTMDLTPTGSISSASISIYDYDYAGNKLNNPTLTNWLVEISNSYNEAVDYRIIYSPSEEEILDGDTETFEVEFNRHEESIEGDIYGGILYDTYKFTLSELASGKYWLRVSLTSASTTDGLDTAEKKVIIDDQLVIYPIYAEYNYDFEFGNKIKYELNGGNWVSEEFYDENDSRKIEDVIKKYTHYIWGEKKYYKATSYRKWFEKFGYYLEGIYYDSEFTKPLNESNYDGEIINYFDGAAFEGDATLYLKWVPATKVVFSDVKPYNVDFNDYSAWYPIGATIDFSNSSLYPYNRDKNYENVVCWIGEDGTLYASKSKFIVPEVDNPDKTIYFTPDYKAYRTAMWNGNQKQGQVIPISKDSIERTFVTGDVITVRLKGLNVGYDTNVYFTLQTGDDKVWSEGYIEDESITDISIDKDIPFDILVTFEVSEVFDNADDFYIVASVNSGYSSIYFTTKTTATVESATGAYVFYKTTNSDPVIISADTQSGKFTLPVKVQDENNEKRYGFEYSIAGEKAEDYVDGRSFVAWYDNPEFTGAPVTELSEEENTGFKAFYAKYDLLAPVYDSNETAAKIPVRDLCPDFDDYYFNDKYQATYSFSGITDTDVDYVNFELWCDKEKDGETSSQRVFYGTKSSVHSGVTFKLVKKETTIKDSDYNNTYYFKFYADNTNDSNDVVISDWKFNIEFDLIEMTLPAYLVLYDTAGDVNKVGYSQKTPLAKNTSNSYIEDVSVIDFVGGQDTVYFIDEYEDAVVKTTQKTTITPVKAADTPIFSEISNLYFTHKDVYNYNVWMLGKDSDNKNIVSWYATDAFASDFSYYIANSSFPYCELEIADNATIVDFAMTDCSGYNQVFVMTSDSTNGYQLHYFEVKYDEGTGSYEATNTAVKTLETDTAWENLDNLNISDISITDNTLTILMRENRYDSENKTAYSRGGIGLVTVGKDDDKKPTFTYSSTLIGYTSTPTSRTSENTYHKINCYQPIEDSESNSSNAEKNFGDYFFGPTKIIGIASKKLYITDEGSFIWSIGNSGNLSASEINRIVEFDLETNTFTNVYYVSDGFAETIKDYGYYNSDACFFSLSKYSYSN